MKLLSGTTAINSAIKSINNRGKKFNADIQVAACSIIAHIEQHGDYTLANSLISAMPKGMRKNALVAWFVAFGRVQLDVDADGKLLDKESPLKFDKASETLQDEGEATMWLDMVKEPEIVAEVDVQKKIDALLKSIMKAEKDGKTLVKKANPNGEDLDTVSLMNKCLEAIKSR